MQNKKKILNKKFSHFIFDIDGVILNSKNNMRLSWIKTNNKFNLKINFSKYFTNIGLPFYQILKNIGVNKNFKEIENEYKKNSIKYSKKILLYKKIKNFFLHLDKNQINYYVVTSKDLSRTKKFLFHYKIFPKSIHCPSKKYKGKPNPDLLNHCIKLNKLDKKNCCYVGDTEFDYIAATKAKIKFIFANYGYGKIKKKYNFVINTPKDLFKYL
jgi:phosphoglycolate phosphatase